MVHQINPLNLEQKFGLKKMMNQEEHTILIAKSNLKLECQKSRLCDYSDPYILVKGQITNTGAGDHAAARKADKKDKGVAFKNCARFTNCMSEVNNTQIDNAKDIDIVIPMHNIIEYSDNYSKASGSLWKYYIDKLNNKTKITGKAPGASNKKDVEIMVPLKYLSNFWRTLEMPLIN